VTSSTALATTHQDGRALYQEILQNAQARFWDPRRAEALAKFEHCFDDRIRDIPSAWRCAETMLAALEDCYTKLLDVPAISKRAAKAEKTEGYASSEILPNNIGLLRIDSFSPENIDVQVRTALRQIKHCDGFIIDLRKNRGGLVNPTVNALELFLDEGMVTSLESKDSSGLTRTSIYFTPETFFKLVEHPDGTETSSNHVRQECMIKGKPVVVLISSSTSSAAELFAAALLESGANFSLRMSVGEKTSGKGIVQETVPLKGCSLVVTSGRYLSPSSRWFGDDGQTVSDGIKPDVRVADAHARSTLRKAHEIVCNHLGKEMPVQPTPAPATIVDPMLPVTMGWLAVGAIFTIGAILLTPSRKAA
jgi:hypothetical protein